ncbi:MAG: oligosaccharide flippase family protein [Clostridia bacterium]|nr:oligosaccharide flippase family protein [Clostridia bacterium]
MNKDKKLIGDGILLTLTTLALKTAGVMFSARLAAAAGAEAMGLSSQIMSVYSFAVTAAAAGVHLGAMRLTSESRGAGRSDEIRSGVRCALRYCAVTGLFTALVLFVLSPLLATRLIGNPEAILPLRVLAVAIPCISASGAFHGYFNGVRRVYKSAAVNVTEQTVRISLTLSGLYGLSGGHSPMPHSLTVFVNRSTEALLRLQSIFSPGIAEQSPMGAACLTVVFGSVCAEAFSFLLLLTLYCFDSKRYPKHPALSHGTRQSLTPKFLHITAPMAVSALLRSGLSSAEHLLLPAGLRRFGSENALAEYGIVGGMAIPVILYPMALMNAFAQLNTVDIAARVSAGESKREILDRVSRGISFALVYGIGCSALLRAFAYPLSNAIFPNENAGEYIAALSAYAALAYLDHIVDSMLKGLDCQGYVMKINIADSALGLLCTATLVPMLGVGGYIISLYLCEFVNCLFSMGKLMSVLGFFPNLLDTAILPALTAALSVALMSFLGIAALPVIPALLLTASFYVSATVLVRRAANGARLCIRGCRSNRERS